MTRHLLWVVLLVIFILEGTLFSWIIPANWQKLHLVFVAPHFTLVFVLFIGLFLHRHTALFYGLVFGLLHDFIYYGHMLGAYSFAMGLTGYLAGLAQRKQPNVIFYNLLIVGIGQLIFELLSYGINRLFKTTNIDLEFAFFHYMLPSVLLNLLFALMIYVPIRKLMDKIEPLPESLHD
ncbi:rod shape-determining protein MreD [Paenibacillus sp. GP183]|jgi:rod shape-determining protein MreD|uniref:rod shape-determining protein MreD n=1 Tax=Paenibacillus sp. GP183 TaxID=1882751 RepID=UPI0008941B8A|nr:rod shape-determining protein MreD [Paenibacillus sp. GP183]SEC72394.1 rod shape-determining protein MreD [Paenibacillus sp. GP183]